jgi:hypothetical protein
MPVFEFRKELLNRPDFSPLRVFKPLPNCFLEIRLGGKIKQALVGSCVLNHGGRLSFHRENHRTFRLSQLLHEVSGPAPEGRKRLDVAGDINHVSLLIWLNTFLSATRKESLCLAPVVAPVAEDWVGAGSNNFPGSIPLRAGTPA